MAEIFTKHLKGMECRRGCNIIKNTRMIYKVEDKTIFLWLG